MNKGKLLSGLAVLLVLSLVACGGPAPVEAPEEAGEAPPAEEEKIELRLWMHQNPAFIAANEEIIKRFEAETKRWAVVIHGLRLTDPGLGVNIDYLRRFLDSLLGVDSSSSSSNSCQNGSGSNDR